jgi:hypothetical protein
MAMPRDSLLLFKTNLINSCMPWKCIFCDSFIFILWWDPPTSRLHDVQSMQQNGPFKSRLATALSWAPQDIIIIIIIIIITVA